MLLLAAAQGSTLHDLAIVLAVAGLTAIAMGRAGVGAIPAFLVAGALSGPFALGLIQSPDSLHTISELAIILLLFGIGLHLDLNELRHGSVWMLVAGLVSIILTILVFWPITLAFGLAPLPALAVAIAMTVSSTALVLRRLMRQRALKLPMGRLSVIILIVQDLAVPFMLVAIDLLAGMYSPDPDSPKMTAMGMAKGAGLSLSGLVALILVGRWLLPPLLRQAASVGGDEVLLILGLAAAIGCAIVTSLLGFSYELGAFLAGLLLGSTPFHLQLGALLAPARDLFMAVFFTTLGMAVDPATLIEVWPVVLIGGTLLALVKASLITFSAWACGAAGAVALATGLTLAQAGEFSLVILQAAENSALITPEHYAATVAIVVLSLILAPLPIFLAPKLEVLASKVGRAPWLKKASTKVVEVTADDRRRVIIGGFGPVGQVAAEALEWMDIDVVVIELNAKTVHNHSALGRRVVYGDVSRVDVLESAGIRDAAAIILTVPDEQAVLRACQHAKHLNPQIRVIARFNYLGKGLLAKSMGADEIVVDEVATAMAMQTLVAEYLKVSPPANQDIKANSPD